MEISNCFIGLPSTATFPQTAKYHSGNFIKFQGTVSLGMVYITDTLMPSRVENEENLTALSMSMAEASFAEFWDEEDDAYWDSY